MAEKTLAEKLLIKPRNKVGIFNAPQGYVESLAPLPDDVKIQTRGKDFDVVQVFVYNKADIDSRCMKAAELVNPGGIVWFTYPKKSGKIKTDISRDTGWDTVVDAGWEGVTQIAIDETWSALRFRPLSEIKVLTRKKTIGKG